MSGIQGKRASFGLDDLEGMQRIAHALSSPVRLDILRQLGKKSMSVGELAQALDLPMSSCALAVKILEEAGIIHAESQPGMRGTVKICSRKLDRVNFILAPGEEEPESAIVLNMPIGGYSSAEGIRPTCGLIDTERYIGEMDIPAAFYLPGRFRAQLLWFQEGFLEYRFSTVDMARMKAEWLELSFEACSEAPMYRDPWKSDIAVEINHTRLGIWTSPCDCGGRRGALTPAWWSDTSTQFGFLKTWLVNSQGTFLDRERIGKVTIGDLDIARESFISVRIGVPADAENIGGLNLFGEAAGDYPQPLRLRIGYSML